MKQWGKSHAVVLAVVVLTVVIALICGVTMIGKNELTGTWYFVNEPDDTITFHSDGTYTSESNGLGSWTFSGTYSIEGNQLTLTTTYYGSTTKSTYTYEINGDEMRYGNDTMRRQK